MKGKETLNKQRLLNLRPSRLLNYWKSQKKKKEKCSQSALIEVSDWTAILELVCLVEKDEKWCIHTWTNWHKNSQFLPYQITSTFAKSSFCLCVFWACPPCFEISEGTQHRFDPRRHPIPRDEQCRGQIVNSERSNSEEKDVDTLPKISSISVSTSVIDKEDLWPAMSLLQFRNGITSVDLLLSLGSEEQEPPTKELKEHLTSMMTQN